MAWQAAHCHPRILTSLPQKAHTVGFLAAYRSYSTTTRFTPLASFIPNRPYGHPPVANLPGYGRQHNTSSPISLRFSTFLPPLSRAWPPSHPWAHSRTCIWGQHATNSRAQSSTAGNPTPADRRQPCNLLSREGPRQELLRIERGEIHIWWLFPAKVRKWFNTNTLYYTPAIALPTPGRKSLINCTTADSARIRALSQGLGHSRL